MEVDTIVAVSTPPGRGAIGVVRASGPDALTMVGQLCPSTHGWTPRHAVHTFFCTPEGTPLDEVVVTYFQSPHSYTGEDMVEISCHGNPVILDNVVEAMMVLGIRAAEPGEFTLRAFLAGRIDLTQAEAVADLVDAKTQAGAGLALRQLEGALKREVAPLQSELLDLLAHMTALVDFSEEDIPEMESRDISARLNGVRSRIEFLLAGAHDGQVLQHGVSLAIVGPPNAGKSSILNRLLGRDRAIVTSIPGTTRDTLEEEMTINGVLFHISDTAGLSETMDPVESMGIERSRQALQAADIVVLVIDGSGPIDGIDESVLAGIHESGKGRRVLIALNKSDLPTVTSKSQVRSLLRESSADRDTNVVLISAVTPDGLEDLKRALPQLALDGPPVDGFVVSNRRHVKSLADAAEALKGALEAQAEGVPLDLVSLDVRIAAQALGQILGQGIEDEVLDRIFSRFCIGK